MPPVVRIRFGEAGHAPVALRGLGALSRAGFATPRLEDGDLVVPYAGFLHAGEAATRENLAGLSADLNLAFGRGPAGEPRRSEAEADEEAAAAPSA
jgi:hypothetical protein